MGRLQVACVVWLSGCGFHSPPGTTSDAEASLCFDGFTRVCLEAQPSMPRIVGSDLTIDTTDGCATTTMGTADGVCVLAATSIEVTTGATLHVTGPRPLLLLATTSMVIAGTLDAASHRAGTVGPGANPAACARGTAPTVAGGSGGGGYGGTFATAGGDGGDSIGRGAKGSAPTTVDVPTTLRGGCPGITGASMNPGVGGVGGAGGGAIELAAGSIEVSGMVNASGAGGQGGVNNDSGGGGGGSGGMVVFDTAKLTITGVVMAQGGGGGGGSGGSGAGQPGADPSVAGTGAEPGDGYHDGGGTLGAGGTGAVATDAGDAQDGTLIGGGGGGGGAGMTKGPPATGTISPPFR